MFIESFILLLLLLIVNMNEIKSINNNIINNNNNNNNNNVIINNNNNNNNNNNKCFNSSSYLLKWKENNIQVNRDYLNNLSINKPHNAVFIHALIGIFKTRNDKKWGYGLDILIEILTTIHKSNLLLICNGIYISLLGSVSDRNDAIKVINNFIISNSIPSYKINIIIECENIYLAELPTLSIMQEYSEFVHPDSKLLYMHTKGVRKNGIGNYPNEWRQYMTYFLVEKYNICFKVLESPYNYDTCGVLRQSNIYAGNFWWTNAKYLSLKRPCAIDIEWSMKNRYAAENYLLNNIYPKNQIKNYCIHHSHHNMQICSTPRSMYENLVINIRDTPQCINRNLFRSNKNSSGWCHTDFLPVI